MRRRRGARLVPQALLSRGGAALMSKDRENSSTPMVTRNITKTIKGRNTCLRRTGWRSDPGGDVTFSRLHSGSSEVASSREPCAFGEGGLRRHCPSVLAVCVRRGHMPLYPSLPRLRSLHPSVRTAPSRDLPSVFTGLVLLPVRLKVRVVASASSGAGGHVEPCGWTSPLGSVADADNLLLTGV